MDGITITGGVDLLHNVSQQQNIQKINQLSVQSSQMKTQDTSSQSMATVADGGRELSKNILYVGNISKYFSNEAFHELFSSTGKPFKSIKILQDKNRPGFNYAFVEYDQPESAAIAFNTLNNKMIDEHELKINYAFQSQQVKNNSTFNLFIGDLSLEVKDELLNKTFAKYKSLVQANVMWDMKTGRSRGYGFVCFNDKEDALDALQTMNGFTVGDRPIKLNWASHKERNNNNNQHSGHINGNYNSGIKLNYYNNDTFSNKALQEPFKINEKHLTNFQNGQMIFPPSYETILKQTPNWLSVVYLGNLSEFTTQNDLIPILQTFGYIVYFKLLPEKGCAFVTYDTHDRAALAIVQLNGFHINGRPLKCGWGKSTIAPMIPINITKSDAQVVKN